MTPENEAELSELRGNNRWYALHLTELEAKLASAHEAVCCLTGENAKLREALEKIANIDGPLLDQLDNCVDIARAALKDKPWCEAAALELPKFARAEALEEAAQRHGKKRIRELEADKRWLEENVDNLATHLVEERNKIRELEAKLAEARRIKDVYAVTVAANKYLESELAAAIRALQKDKGE